jgi:glyoxylase-like metal-dependent hydrolase (beta-lactamase superfamily II)
MRRRLIFRQLFDPETSTYTYLLGDEETRDCVLIDPVLEQFERDLTLIRELALTLTHTLETHVHADHVTASGRFRESVASRVAVGARTGVRNADVYLEDRDTIVFGGHTLEVRVTPGHTEGCVTFVLQDEGLAFTGDALLIRGCGRTDFQGGDASKLFESVRKEIFSLPDTALLYPGHDYKGRTATTVDEEKHHNARLALEKSEAEFVGIMDKLKLAFPKRMEIAVPANLNSGLQPEGPEEGSGAVAGVMEELGRQDTEGYMGLGI